MRNFYIRYDLLICLFAAFGLGWLGLQAAKPVVAHFETAAYEEYRQTHTMAEGEVGGPAGEDTPRARNVTELLTYDTFTVVADGMDYMNHGVGYGEEGAFRALLLPSGQLVAALIDGSSVRHVDDDIFKDAILPVGRVVYQDLTKQESMLRQIEAVEPLSRTDFYVDMLGGGGAMSRERYHDQIMTYVEMGAAALGIAVFCLTHALGSSLGVFPAFFRRKPKPDAPVEAEIRWK